MAPDDRAEHAERALESIRAQADELRRALRDAMTRARGIAFAGNQIPIHLLDEVHLLEERIGTLVWIEMQIEAAP
jgi:hypothetical protein